MSSGLPSPHSCVDALEGGHVIFSSIALIGSMAISTHGPISISVQSLVASCVMDQKCESNVTVAENQGRHHQSRKRRWNGVAQEETMLLRAVSLPIRMGRVGAGLHPKRTIAHTRRRRAAVIVYHQKLINGQPMTGGGTPAQPAMRDVSSRERRGSKRTHQPRRRRGTPW